MKDDVIVSFLMLLFVLVIVFSLSYFFHSWSCEVRARQMGVPFQYGAISGCMIKPKGQDWVPLENYRVM
jgi:hypothetical protein